MRADLVRELIAQQRAIEARNQPRLCGEPSVGNVVVFVMSVIVIAYAVIDGVIRLLP